MVLRRQTHRLIDPARQGVDGLDVPATAALARLEDSTGLPSAYIEVGRLDVFRDEDTAYATKLSRADAPVEFRLHPGGPQELASIAFDSDVARRAVADRVRSSSRFEPQSRCPGGLVTRPAGVRPSTPVGVGLSLSVPVRRATGKEDGGCQVKS
ncbi:alpha/beta hydrolase fold domain-containing protein [Streptomyces sp. NPDC057236]|uniref:alpha/beta hydrolase fold domain-containing protein n=1 Tax=Streptomyces sp. NPDC057236 TaxID=3346059 RepID=UPI00362FA24F